MTCFPVTPAIVLTLMRSLILSLILSLLSSSLLAESRPIAPAPKIPTSFSISGPSVAAANGRFLTTWWVDTFVGTRIDGMPVDEIGRRISDSARRVVSGATSAKVLRLGNGFLLAYEDSRRMRRFMRLAPDGNPLGDSGLPAFTNAPIVLGSVDGRRALVVRYETDRITGVLLDEDMSIIRGDLYLARSTSELFGISAVADGFVVLNRDPAGLRLARLNADGIVGPSSVLLEATPTFGSFFTAAAASDADHILVFWASGAPGQNVATAGALIERGAVLKRISVPSSELTALVPRQLFWTGEQYVLLVNGRKDDHDFIGAVRFSREGELVDAQPIRLASGAQKRISFSGAAWNGKVLYVTAYEPTFTGARGLGIAFRPDAPEDHRTEVLSLLPARQNAPATASDGLSSLAVWRESGADGERLRASLITNGAPSEASTLMTAEGFVGEPVVAYGGGVYLVVWEFFHHILGFRISREGVILDPPLITIAASENGGFARPAIAWNGARFLVAWSGSPLRGTFVSTTASVDPARDLTAADDGGDEPALAWNGHRFLLAYTRTFGPLVSFPPFPVQKEVHAIALDANAISIASSSRVLVQDGWRPDVATSGGEFLVTTDVLRPDEGRVTLAGSWVDSSGQPVGGTFDIGPVASNSDIGNRNSAVAWTGELYAVATHAFAFDSRAWQLQVGFLAPLSTRVTNRRMIESRPDWLGGTSVAIATQQQDPLVVFSDIRHDDDSGGSSRVLLERIADLPAPHGRRRAVSH